MAIIAYVFLLFGVRTTSSLFLAALVGGGAEHAGFELYGFQAVSDDSSIGGLMPRPKTRERLAGTGEQHVIELMLGARKYPMFRLTYQRFCLKAEERLTGTMGYGVM